MKPIYLTLMLLALTSRLYAAEFMVVGATSFPLWTLPPEDDVELAKKHAEGIVQTLGDFRDLCQDAPEFLTMIQLPDSIVFNRMVTSIGLVYRCSSSMLEEGNLPKTPEIPNSLVPRDRGEVIYSQWSELDRSFFAKAEKSAFEKAEKRVRCPLPLKRITNFSYSFREQKDGNPAVLVISAEAVFQCPKEAKE